MGWLEQRAQGVVGDGPAVRGVCDEGQPGLGRPVYLSLRSSSQRLGMAGTGFPA